MEGHIEQQVGVRCRGCAGLTLALSPLSLRPAVHPAQAVVGAYGLCSAIYLVVSVVGYWAYGNVVSGFLLDMFDHPKVCAMQCGRCDTVCRRSAGRAAAQACVDTPPACLLPSLPAPQWLMTVLYLMCVVHLLIGEQASCGEMWGHTCACAACARHPLQEAVIAHLRPAAATPPTMQIFEWVLCARWEARLVAFAKRKFPRATWVRRERTDINGRTMDGPSRITMLLVRCAAHAWQGCGGVAVAGRAQDMLHARRAN